MAPQMKGLTQFITDLRNSHDYDEERKRINVEINNIRTKFASGMNSYQKKKYVCKLIYMHLLGYTEEVKFGLVQSLDLIRLPDYLEKLLGYLLVSVLFTRDGGTLLEFYSDLLDLVHPELVLDLRVNSEDVNCLALQFIAANFNVMPENGLVLFEPVVSDGHADAVLWQEIIDMVYSFCVSPIARANTKKRAVTALNVLLKLYPQVILNNDNWIPRLLTLVDETDLSVVLSAVPLVRLLTDVSPHYAKSIVPSIANRLYALVVDQDCPREYFYYDNPSPWLVINLIQLVEHFFLPSEQLKVVPLTTAVLDNSTVSKLRQVVSRSIQNASKSVKGLPNRNSQSAILFQAVSLATFLDASPEAIEGAIHALLTLLDSSETNTRYLVLDALIKLSARTKHTSFFNEALENIFKCLHDKDVSVRKKTVDLLFTICDSSTYTSIISKFLDYYPVAESSLKVDIAVKVAVLAEQFATDSIWYVSTMLRLLALGGQSSKTTGVTNRSNVEVWERITQIVVNNEDLHTKASRYIINLLRKAEGGTVPENLVRVAAFILGEFGYKLVDKDDVSSHFTPSKQFQLLFEAYFKVSLASRPIILTAFLKFIYRFSLEDFVPDILDLLEAETQSLDLEIQTRAYEYLKVASYMVSGDETDRRFAKSLITSMPPFENKKNTLLNYLGSVKLVNGRSSSTVNVLKIPNHSVLVSAIKSTKDIPERSTSPNSGYSDEEHFDETTNDPFGDGQTELPQLSPNWYPGYHRMLQYDAGIFYEDQLVKITYRTTKEAHNIHVQFSIINNAAKTANATISAFTVREIHNAFRGTDPAYIVSLTQVPELTIQVKSNMEIDVKVRDIFDNSQSPVLSLTYKCSGSFNTLNLKVPTVLIKTLSGTALGSLDEFKKRWLQIGEHLGTVDGERRGVISAQFRHSSSNIVRILQRIGFAIVHSTQDSEEGVLVMGAGILHTMRSKSGVLVMMKSLDQVGKEFDIVVRSTGGGVSGTIYETLEEIFL